MSAISMETGTIIQLVTVAAGAAVVWAQLREQQAEMRAGIAQLTKLAEKLERGREKDGGRIRRVEHRVTKIETILEVKPPHDSEPPSGEDEEG